MTIKKRQSRQQLKADRTGGLVAASMMVTIVLGASAAHPVVVVTMFVASLAGFGAWVAQDARAV
jgi:hypothetical protein